MKKLYDKHFRILENEKIKEHVMKMRILFAIAVICISMMSMGITAYAFFSCTVSSSNNVIKSAHFKLDKTWDEASKQYVTEEGNGWYLLNNTSGGNLTYQLKMRTSGSTTASVGYAKIEIAVGQNTESNVCYTDPIYKSSTEDYIIKISIPNETSIRVRVVDNWGTCAVEPFIQSGTEVIPIPLSVNEDPEDESQSDEQQSDTGTGSESGEMQEPENDEPVSGEDDQDTPSDGVTGKPEEGTPEVNPEEEPEGEPETDTEGGTPEETPEETPQETPQETPEETVTETTE